MNIKESMQEQALRLFNAVGGKKRVEVRFIVAFDPDPGSSNESSFVTMVGDLSDPEWFCEVLNPSPIAAVDAAIATYERRLADKQDRIKRLNTQAAELGYRLVKIEEKEAA